MTKLPNMLIVGAAKCGTTTGAAVFASHPEVFMSTPKELSYFVDPEYRRTQTWEAYLQHFDRAGDAKVIGEASVAYLHDPSSAEAIYQCLGPDVKIVVFVRSPVDMAYSLWGHMRRLEREPLTFQEAVEASEQRASGERPVQDWLGNYQYVDRARYTGQIDRYRRRFGTDHVRIIVFEEMIERPGDVIAGLFEWLSLSPLHIENLPKLNAAGSNRWPWLQRLLDGRSGGKRLGKRIIPLATRQSIRKMTERLNRRPIALPELSLSYRRTLEARFYEDVATLSEWTGRDLSSRWFVGQPPGDDGDIG